MTPGADPFANMSHGMHLKAGDWDVMFCAVLARLGSAIEPLDLQSPQWACLPECIESLEMLRSTAMQQWGQLEQANALTSAVLLTLTEAKSQAGDASGPRSAP